MDRIRDLSDLARDVNESLESLIRFGASGELTIYVIARDWPVRSNGDIQDKLKGPVFLLAEDLHQSLNAQVTSVTQVRRPSDDEVVTLDEPVDVPRGVHFVSAEEAERFSNEHALTLRSNSDTPSYLNKNHPMKSPQLAAAIQAWVALFADNTFDPRGRAVKQRIEEWLTKNHGELSITARENIATLINPKIYKDGGTPRTPGEKT